MRSLRIRDGLRYLATHDFAPEISAKVRRFLYHPFGILLLAGLVALLCGLFLHHQGFVLCGGILAVIALGVIWPWLSLRGIQGTLSFDRLRASEGDSVEVRLTLRNRLPWPAWGLAVRGGFGGDAAEAVVGIVSTPRRRAVRCRWLFSPPGRGIYPLVTPKLTTGFPFGLWNNRRELTTETPLIVWPRTYPVGPIPPASSEHLVEGNVSRSKVGSNGDVLGVRPYRRGDSPRRIHWGQTARHDRLIVCELQSNSRPVIQIILDGDPRVHVGSGPSSTWEWAIRVAASFAKGWLEGGAQIGIAWDNQHIPPASGQSQLHRILDALAGLPPACDKPLAEVLDSHGCRGFRDGLQVIITTDRACAPGGFRASETEDRRWVVLKTGGFAQIPTTDDPATQGLGLKPWLLIESPETIPNLLKGGWREARHGS